VPWRTFRWYHGQRHYWHWGHTRAYVATPAFRIWNDLAMEDVASVLAGDTHVADEAGCDADARPVLVPPLAERDQATADEV
jgi:hypothetical protein